MRCERRGPAVEAALTGGSPSAQASRGRSFVTGDHGWQAPRHGPGSAVLPEKARTGARSYHIARRTEFRFGVTRGSPQIYGVALCASAGHLASGCCSHPNWGKIGVSSVLAGSDAQRVAWRAGPGLLATGASAWPRFVFVRPLEGTVLAAGSAPDEPVRRDRNRHQSLRAGLESARRTAEINAETALAAHDQTRAILESISDEFQALDSDFRFVYVNRAAELAMGVSRTDLIGKCIWDVYPAVPGTEVERQYRSVMSQRESAHFESFFEPLQKWFSIHAYPSASGGISIYSRDVTERKAVEHEKEQLIEELKAALSKVRLLSGLLPICASCKKIRDDSGQWHQLETFIRAHSEARFSHGVCPECAKQLYPEYDLESPSESQRL